MIQIATLEVPACPTAIVDGHATHADLSMVIGRLIDLVWPFVRAHGLKTNHNIVLYKGNPGSPEGADVEVGVQVDRAFTEQSPDGVRSSELPASKIARAIHVGPYNQMGETYEALTRWIEENGLVVDGPSWEIYGDWDDDPAKLQTEICIVVR